MPIYTLDGHAPNLPDDGDFWVAPDANLIGQVILKSGSSVWFGATIRGDNEPITVGQGSNIQESCILHTDMGFPLEIGEDCTIGHRVTLHGCQLGARCLVGMGSTIMNGARIGDECLIGAGSLITENKTIPDGSLVMGRPGKVIRQLDADERKALRLSAKSYQDNMRRFGQGLDRLSD